jgi:type IX secretion system PorP/SprF family membrane protein
MKKILFIVVTFLIFNVIYAQDIHFSQYNYSPLTLNPANTGAFNGDIRICANYKNQWGKIASPYRTYATSYDMSILKGTWKKGYLGIGLQFFDDRAGDAKMGLTQFNLSASAIREISSNTNLAIGIQGGFAQRSINFNSLTWDSQYDGMAYNSALASYEVGGSSVNYSDYSAGVLWNYGKGDMYSTANNAIRTHIGLAFFHVNNPNQSFIGRTDKLDPKYVFHGGASVGIKNTNFSLCPDYMLLIQGQAKEFTFGNAFKYNLQEASRYTGNIKGRAMYLGVHYRFADALILSYFLELDKYAFGVSYDINISSLTKATSGLGGIELSLRFLNFTSTSTTKTGHSNTKFL